MDPSTLPSVFQAAFASASSKAKKLKMAIGSPPRPADAFKSFAELSETAGGQIKALVCRAWETKNPFGKYLGTEFILADEQGFALHCIARSSIAHCVVPKLQVGRIYSIGRFTIAPNKETYRVRRDDAILIHLEGNTVIKELECSSNGFVRHPFQLMDIDSIAFNGNKFLIDVIGRVVNLGSVKPTTNGSQYIDFHLINERGKTIRVTLWGALCKEITTRAAGPNMVYVIILPALSIRDYKQGIHLSSTSATCILDSFEISEIAAMHKLLSATPLPPPDNMGTLLQLLDLGREQKDDTSLPSRTIVCPIKIVGVRPQNSWNYYSCGVGGCTRRA